jgi:GDP-mannose 6-dehydrogenase
MKISIFGLGYVGCVTAACLAQDGHTVIGVDANYQKMDLIRKGQSPIKEPGLDALIKEGVSAGTLQVCPDSTAAVCESDISLICVGTPSNGNGSLQLRYVENVCREIALAVAIKKTYHVVVIRSTVLPGTVENKLIPILEEVSGLKAGIDFGVATNPEFLREGSAIKDYLQPSFIVIGSLDRRGGEMVAELYRSLNAPVIHTQMRTAQMVKYASNAYHALKVTFANEIGNLCKVNGIDGQEVMEIFSLDNQLNTSSAYLRPGFAFGGSCLPKDLRAMLYQAKEFDVDCTVLGSILPSNRRQVELGISLIEQTGRKKIGILGLSFKADTDDLRESPAVVLVETLLGRGYELCIFDEQVELEQLVGANKSFLERELPHIASLIAPSLDELVAHAEVLVITNGSRSFHRIPELMNADQTLIDLVGLVKVNGEMKGTYKGICW